MSSAPVTPVPHDRESTPGLAGSSSNGNVNVVPTTTATSSPSSPPIGGNSPADDECPSGPQESASQAPAPSIRSPGSPAGASAVHGNFDPASPLEDGQGQDGEPLYTGSAAASSPLNRASTPVHTEREDVPSQATTPTATETTSSTTTATATAAMHPISTDFTLNDNVVIKTEQTPAPMSYFGQSTMSSSSPSDPSYSLSYYSHHSVPPPMDVTRVDSSSSSSSLQVISPTQLSPRQGSEGDATLPQTPASASFPFGYNYHTMSQAGLGGYNNNNGQYPVAMPDITQSAALGYNSALSSVESTNSAFGYNLAAYSHAQVNYEVPKAGMTANSLGLDGGMPSVMAQSGMSSYNHTPFMTAANTQQPQWSMPPCLSYIAPENLQQSLTAPANGSASPLRAMSPTPSDSDDDETRNSEDSPMSGIAMHTAPALGGGASVFSQQQDESTAALEGIRSTRRATMHTLQTDLVGSPRRSARRRSSVGLSLRGARAPLSDGAYSGKREPLILDDEERARYEREAAERDQLRVKEMQEFEQGPLKGNKKERRRMQNRLAQRSFRARSKIQNQEAVNHMQHLEALTEAQQTRLTRMQELMERLQRENASLKSERWSIIQQVSALGLKMPEGLGNFSVSGFGLDTADATTLAAAAVAQHGLGHAHRYPHTHASALGLASMEESAA